MKIRADFVTNSSSSSFSTITIRSPKLVQALKKYKLLEVINENNGYIRMWGDEISCTYAPENSGDSFYFVPSSRTRAIEELLSIIACIDNEEDYDEREDDYEEDEKDEDNLSEHDKLVRDIFEEIRAVADQLADTIEYCLAESGYEGDGGDSDTRFWYDYPEEMKQKLYEIIAKEKGYDSTEIVTEDDWEEFLTPKAFEKKEFYLFDASVPVEETGERIALDRLEYSYNVKRKQDNKGKKIKTFSYFTGLE